MNDIETPMENNQIELTINNTDKSINEYIKTRYDFDIVINHLNTFSSLINGEYILDVGCGHGRDCEFFAMKGFKVIGIDLSNKMLQVAKERCKEYRNIKFKKLDMRNIDFFALNRFDGIWCCASFYHIPKIYSCAVLRKFNNVLKDDGILFLAIKKGNGEKTVYKDDLNVDKFYSFYDENEITYMLEQTGFKILNIIVEEKKDIWINVYAKKIVKPKSKKINKKEVRCMESYITRDFVKREYIFAEPKLKEFFMIPEDETIISINYNPIDYHLIIETRKDYMK